MGMSLERKQDLSIYYWLTNLFTSYPQVTIVDGYPEDDLVLPTISIENGEVVPNDYELGNRYPLRQRYWTIVIYAKNKAQREDFSSFIHNNLENGIIVYDYDQGFPPTVVPQYGDRVITPQYIVVTPVRIFPDLTELLYWKAVINFYDIYEKE